MPLPRLAPETAALLEKEITEDEIIHQIGKLPNNKAAGADGLRAELLKLEPKLWAKALQPIYENILHDTKSLPQPFRESIIILIYKKGCPFEPCNYRPIALLNVIAKLLSGIHNNRLRDHLASIIPPEQTGFVPKRSISENITLLQDATFFAKRHHPSAIILSLDFQKAYDRVQRPVLLAILKKMGFGPRWLTIISTMYERRVAKLCINGKLSSTFALQRGVLQGDPLSPALFILQCSPLYARLNEARQAHGIPLPHGQQAPVATFYADDTNLMAKSPDSAVDLYNIAQWFCDHSGAKLHPNKCVAIASGPSATTLPNGIKILNHNDHTTILGILMGTNTNRQTQSTNVITKMIQRCNAWSHVGRTIEGKTTIARAMLLSTVWYVLGVIPINAIEAKQLQRAINNYIHGATNIEWNGPTTRAKMSSQWFYRHKEEGGWGLTPILQTLQTRKLSMIRQFLHERSANINKPWHTFICHMLEEHMKSWGRTWNDILTWKGNDHHSQSRIGNWEAISPWWRDAWRLWIRLDLKPRKHSIPLNELTRWPIWHNRILEVNHGIHTTLHRFFSNTDTRAIMTEIRNMGFISFADFMSHNGAIMHGDELYTLTTVYLSVHDRDYIIPRWACTRLTKIVQALWANATRQWLLTSSNMEPAHNTRWWHHAFEKKDFTTAHNKQLARMLLHDAPPTAPPQLIRLNQRPVTIDWKRERAILSRLAPSRRDLMLRLLRNALPLGVKRIHWATAAQTRCMLCDANELESAQHLFWECEYARATWNNLTNAWRDHRRSPLSWKEILTGTDVRLDGQSNECVDQLWSIVRACTIRSIWFERNRRYFYADLPPRSTSFRHNQSVDDIRAHIQCWHNRANDDTRPKLNDTLAFLATKPAYNRFLPLPQQPTNHTPEPPG